MVRSIITRMLGRASGEGQKVFFSILAPVGGSDAAISYHQASISRILSDSGLRPHADHGSGLAVVFGELAESNFSGIGISVWQRVM